MEKRFSRCIVHIGTEKTGSTAIQQFLVNNRGALLDNGIYYPDLGRGGSQWELIAAAHPTPWNFPGIAREFLISDSPDASVYRYRLIAALENAFSQLHDAQTLVLSSEHFHSLMADTQSIASLKAFLEPWASSFEIVVFFRRQDRVAVSLNSTRIKSGAPNLSFSLPKKFEKVTRYYRYNRIFDDWASVFGDGSINSFVYQEGTSESVVHSFAEFIGFSSIEPIPRDIHNPSLNGDGLRILAKVNELIKEDSVPNYGDIRKRAVSEVTKRYAGKHYPIDRKTAESFYSLFSDVNAELAARAFPDHDLPVFDEDFSEYPEEVSRMDLDEEGLREEARFVLETVYGAIATETKPPRISDRILKVFQR